MSALVSTPEQAATVVNSMALDVVNILLRAASLLAAQGVAIPVACDLVRDAALSAAIGHHRSAAHAGHVPADDNLIRRAFEHCLALPVWHSERQPDGSWSPPAPMN